jgi:hypothetical protein
MKQEQKVNVVVNVGEDKLKLKRKRKKKKKTGAGAGAGVARQQPIVLNMPPPAQPFVPSYQPVQGFTPERFRPHNVPQEVAPITSKPITSNLTEENVARMEGEQGTEFAPVQQYRERIKLGSSIDDDLSVSDITDFTPRDADPNDIRLSQFTKDMGRQLTKAEEAQKRVGFDERSIGQSSQGALTFIEAPVQDLKLAESEERPTIGRGRGRGRPLGSKDKKPRQPRGMGSLRSMSVS